MSWLDDIVGVGKTVFGGDSLGSSLARTAVLAGTMYMMNRNNNKESAMPGTAGSATVDATSRLQIDPDPEQKIPVVYGTAHLGGIITDAQISNDNTRMTYVITICEKTGTQLSDNMASVIEILDIYVNDQRVVFKSDGATVNYTVDKDSNVDYTYQDLVKIYCYSGSSTTTDCVPPGGVDGPYSEGAYTSFSRDYAYNRVPNWDSNYMMNDLVFAIVQIDYNRDRNINQVPTVKFQVSNSMTLPGDCIYDYMTNTRYGAGIDAAEIND